PEEAQAGDPEGEVLGDRPRDEHPVEPPKGIAPVALPEGRIVDVGHWVVLSLVRHRDGYAASLPCIGRGIAGPPRGGAVLGDRDRGPRDPSGTPRVQRAATAAARRAWCSPARRGPAGAGGGEGGGRFVAPGT